MPLLDLFWTMLWFFLFFMWIWLLISLFSDIFRRDDIGGWGKAGWIFFLLVLPLLGALIYIIADGKGMAERQVKDAMDMKKAQDEYIRSVAGNGGGSSSADELSKLAALRDSGALTEEEFAAQKAKLLA
ncbi:MAG TPA: SHOCT domain-containing protein [Acidimicrobiia bacterium]|nr:SHOCT domain-containing protein [Acidimicrobiia bacterium]